MEKTMASSSIVGVDQRQVKLPPGVYFNPGPEESVCNYLNRRIAGDEMPDTEGIIFRDVDVYGESPDVLRRRYQPGIRRSSKEWKWYFFSDRKLHAGGGARRAVATGGNWRVEQVKKDVVVVRGAADGGGRVVGSRQGFAFYDERHLKTEWRMEEYTSSLRDGSGGGVVPVFCKVYVSPREKVAVRRSILGEDAVSLVGRHRGKMPPRVVVLPACFDAVAARLPPESVRGVVHDQEQSAAQVPPPPPSPGMVMGYPVTEAMVIGYPVCQELGLPQLDTNGDNFVDIVARDATAGAQQEEETPGTTTPPPQESLRIIINGVSSKLDVDDDAVLVARDNVAKNPPLPPDHAAIDELPAIEEQPREDDDGLDEMNIWEDIIDDELPEGRIDD